MWRVDGTAQAHPRQAGERLAQSILLSAGQFCTKPGVVFVPEGEGGDELVDALTTSIAGWDAAPLLAERIQTSLETRMRQTAEDLEADSPPASSENGYRQRAAIFETAVAELLEQPRLLEEMSGPAAVVVRYADVSKLTPVWDLIGGSLTATLLLEDSDEDGARRLVTELTRLAGRVIFNGVPTGVAVTHAMHHGGPFPATTDPAQTSVGATAIRRFLRPVVYQDCPPSLLPAHLRDENLVGIPRTVDGEVVSAGSAS